ncbi:hypothetical protein DM02DRAFT_609199 [Periconia macrospinosa]|uniref:Uncharacterized protein n=1 Tax=Periconia macrospinosa TaxID=97972 RepID=A0A2V1ED93_9PLEO|nr:hypothetical protein DM02DRAFT_609199 [Periconia macrospinosa]
MEARRTLLDLVELADVTPVRERNPCLPAASQPALVVSEEDHTLARHLLVEQRRNSPEYKDPSKQLKRIFKSSKEKEKLQDTNLWDFSQEELDKALSSVIEKPATSPGLVQAFLNLGAKVNFVETYGKKNKSNQSNNAARRRSTVLQRAATTRRADSVSLLASSGADQTTLDEGLKVALGAHDYPCVQELLRHGADLGKFPNALADAVRSGDQNFVQLLLRAPKALRPEVVSSCLPAAVQQQSERIVSLLIGYGGNPNFDNASALKTVISQGEYRLAVALVAGPTPLSSPTLQNLLGTTLALPTAQLLYKFMELLFCCGLPPSSPHLAELLITATKRNDTAMAQLLLANGVSTELNQAECLRNAIEHNNWRVSDAIINASVSPAQASVALAVVSPEIALPERLHVITALVSRGAKGKPLDQALIDAVGDTSNSRDVALIQELVVHGANPNHEGGKAIHLAVIQRDVAVLRLLCTVNPSSYATSTALPLTMSSDGTKNDATIPMIDILLANDMDSEPVQKALRTAIQGGPKNIDIIERFLTKEPRFTDYAFQYAAMSETVNIKRPIMQALLAKGISQDALDRALAAETKFAIKSKDTTLVELLMQYGASAIANEGEALQTAVSVADNSLVKLHLSGKDRPSGTTITKAFLALFYDYKTHCASRKLDDCINIAQELLELGVDQSAIDSALPTVIEPGNLNTGDRPLIDLLLRWHANVNASDGICFMFAARRSDRALFSQLLAFQPNYTQLVPKLVEADLSPASLIELLELCFEHNCTADELEASRDLANNKPLLISMLSKYPRNESLVQLLLLTYGCNPNVFVTDTADEAIGEETMSVLTWALSRPQKLISSAVIQALLDGGVSPTRPTSISEMSPIALAAREGRADIAQVLLSRGADPSVRDKWNRSPLFYASSASVPSTAELLAPTALRNDGSLHEAARSLHFDTAKILVQQGHNPNFPSRLHNGRSALGELCLNAQVTTGTQQTKLRQLIRLFLDNGATAKFQARNEKSCVLLALDNPHSALDVTDALLETETWQDLNDAEHMFRDPATGLWYSPFKYVELRPSPSRARSKTDLLDLLRDKACLPKYYSETENQPPGAIGMPAPIARLADRQKEHELTLKLATEASEHARKLDETKHRDALRRAKEAKDAELAAAALSASHAQALEKQRHDFEIQRVREAEGMKRAEKQTWHRLLQDQEREAAELRASVEDRKAAHEKRLIEARKSEVEHRANAERRALKEKEEVYDRNVKRQLQITKRVDESAELHARLRQDRPAIEQAQWGSVD